MTSSSHLLWSPTKTRINYKALESNFCLTCTKKLVWWINSNPSNLFQCFTAIISWIDPLIDSLKFLLFKPIISKAIHQFHKQEQSENTCDPCALASIFCQYFFDSWTTVSCEIPAKEKKKVLDI